MDQQINNLISKEIEGNDVCLFMKGTPDAPQCGFSMAVTNILKIVEVNFKSYPSKVPSRSTEFMVISPTPRLSTKYKNSIGFNDNFFETCSYTL